MTTKDATPYNVQFKGTDPVFIDIASFEPHRPGEPWWGYRQFCQMFLYPLMLTAYKNLPHQPWMRGAIDGITPQQARRILQGRRHSSKGMLTHVWLQARASERLTGGSASTVKQLAQAGYNDNIYTAMIRRLQKLVDSLTWKHPESAWDTYTQRIHYTSSALSVKTDFVRSVLAQRQRRCVWDVGANDGAYSRTAADHADLVIAMDADSSVIDRLYRALREESIKNIVPLVVDFADPTPAIGWRNAERPQLNDRSKPDMVLALAVIHHLAITHNIPTDAFLDCLADLDTEVVLEIPTESDPMVEQLLTHKRAGVHDDYTIANIEAQALRRFSIRAREQLPNQTRVMLHLTPHS